MGKTYYLGNNENESIKVDIFYTDPFIGKGISNEKGNIIASLNDIIPMKIKAILNRGSKKDFWDLHEILERYSFEEIMDLYNTKFPYEEINYTEIYEKFLFFDKADLENNPDCLKGKYWVLVKEDIKNYVDGFFKKQGLKL